MLNRVLATLTAGAAASLSRRASLLGLGGAALAAAGGGPAPARAGKAGKKAKKACKRQIGTCETSVKAFCASDQIEDPEGCESVILPCCAFFKNCRAGDVYECLFDVPF